VAAQLNINLIGQGAPGAPATAASAAGTGPAGNQPEKPPTPMMKRAQKIKGFLGKTAKTVSNLGPGGKSGAGGLGSAAGSVLSTAAKAGPYGAVLAGFVAVGKAAFDLAEQFVERGKELAKYSPELTTANARSTMRSVQGDIRESQELGPGIASMTDTLSEMNEMIRDFMLPIKKVVVEVLVEVLNFIKAMIEVVIADIAAIKMLMYDIGQLIKAIYEGKGGYASQILDAMPKKMGEAFANKLEELRKKSQPADMLAKWRELTNGENTPEFKVWGERAQNQRMNIPAALQFE
jgi:hypothetical protein